MEMLPNPHDLAAVRASCDDEIEIIWPKSKRSWVKWKFLFLRYFTIAVQLWADPLQVVDGIDSDRSLQSLFAAMSICIWRKVEMRNAMNAIEVEAPSGSFPYLGWVPLVPKKPITHNRSVIVALTIIKHCKDMKQGTRSSIMTLLLRDGILAFLASSFITCIAVVTVIYSSVYAVMSYLWLISISASLGCRIMINLERYWKPSRTLFEPTMILTELSSAFFDEESDCTSEFNQSRTS
ncbi:hypothetical protein F5887DRAFT_1164064 [Amanita rubescens]|nr:hypothetical protein F5887DRAFT_1165336 [Amanita rubescens]KAF8327821.1 hypothetical protein F5887DRAFT_1164064 [Amanita rubescens]